MFSILLGIINLFYGLSIKCCYLKANIDTNYLTSCQHIYNLHPTNVSKIFLNRLFVLFCLCLKERSNKLNFLILRRMRNQRRKQCRRKTSRQLKPWLLPSWSQNQETLPLQTKAVSPDATAARPRECASRTSRRKKQSPATWTE